MSDNIINNREITGVAGNKINTSLGVDCGFYPIVKFELPSENTESAQKGVKLMSFDDSDQYNEKKKSFIQEMEYPHLKEKDRYFVPFLSVRLSEDESRIIKLSCITSEGTFDCLKKGKVQIKMPNSNTIAGISISTEFVDNVYIEDEFTLDIVLSKDIDIEKFDKFDCYPLIFTVVNDNKETEVGRIHLAIEPELKQYIYLLGSSEFGQQNTFTAQMELRKNRILKSKKANEKYVFYVIDLPKGKIRKYEYPGKEKGESFDDLGKFDSINSSNYKNNRFTSGGKNIFSKKDAYKLIEQIGQDTPGTVCEFTIFSHAHSKGAILVNSNQYNDDGSINMDDHDMRTDDYQIIDTTSLSSAFVCDGAIYNLGCNSSPHLNNILKQVMEPAKYNRLNLGKYKSDGSTPNETVFILADHFFNNKLISAYAINKKDLGNGQFEMTMFDLKKTFALYYLNTYAAYMAKYTNINVVSSLPSTYSIFVDPINTNKPIEFRISSDTKMNSPFFKSYFGVEITDENYGIFTKDMVEKIEKEYSINIK